MAKKTIKEVKVLTKEEQIANAIAYFSSDRTQPELQPTPTWSFTVGEQVDVGMLKEVFIEQILFDGMAYVYRALHTSRDCPEGKCNYSVGWWFDIDKFGNTNNDVPQLMSKFRVFPTSTADISSLLHNMSSGGLVVDPQYQREYVWSEENKDALIESIFDRLDIGSFLLVRHQGYHHAGDESMNTYRTMDGKLVQIKNCDDHSVSIVDGQQRLTTILDFIQNRRPYKGIYFTQLNGRDQREFLNKSVVFRIINEEETNKKEILRMFLQSNRGVPQQPEHIAKVQALYDAMK